MSKDFKRVVVKVGSSTLTHPSGLINIRRIEHLVKVLSDIMNAGIELILVSSGAGAVGMGKLGLREKPKELPKKQAVAAVGQCELMYLYDSLFSEYNHTTAQVLLTRDVFDNPIRLGHATNTFHNLLDFNVLPIVNENDTVAVEEFSVGDNDTLGALVTVAVEADCLIILSDIDGLFTANPAIDPEATLITYVPTLTDELFEIAGGAGSAMGTGGMITKLSAARRVTENGISMAILNGKDPDNLYRFFEDENIGTFFSAQ